MGGYEGPGTDFQREMRSGVGEEILGRCSTTSRVPSEMTTGRPLTIRHTRPNTQTWTRTTSATAATSLTTNTTGLTKTTYPLNDHRPHREGRLLVYPSSTAPDFDSPGGRTPSDVSGHFRFDGPPSAAFRQIGNAVPPHLGFVLGQAVLKSLEAAVEPTTNTRETARRLSSWMESTEHIPILPWLRATSRWIFIVAEILLDRATTANVTAIWPELEKLAHPSDIGEEGRRWQAERLRYLAAQIDRGDRAERIIGMAEAIASEPLVLDGSAETMKSVLKLPDSVADLAVLVVPSRTDPGDADNAASEEPVLVTKGVLRVAGRFEASMVHRKNRLTDGRLAIARMIGFGIASRDAHRGLIELAASVCRPEDPSCHRCPLNLDCRQDGVDNTQYLLW